MSWRKTRSQLYTEAMVEYLTRHEPDTVTARLNAVLDTLPEQEDRFVNEPPAASSNRSSGDPPGRGLVDFGMQQCHDFITGTRVAVMPTPQKHCHTPATHRPACLSSSPVPKLISDGRFAAVEAKEHERMGEPLGEP